MSVKEETNAGRKADRGGRLVVLSLFAGGKAKAAPGLGLQGFYSSLEMKTTINILRLNIFQVPLVINFL